MKDAGHLWKISKIAGLFNELFTISENWWEKEKEKKAQGFNIF